MSLYLAVRASVVHVLERRMRTSISPVGSMGTARAERHGQRPTFRYYAKAPEGPIGPIVPRYPVKKAEVTPEPKQEVAPNHAVVAMMDKAKELFDTGHLRQSTRDQFFAFD